jgi:hypothetical protein
MLRGEGWRTKLTTEPNKMGEPARVKSLLAHLLKATGPGIADCWSSNNTRWQQLGLLPQPTKTSFWVTFDAKDSYWEVF